MRAKGPIGYYLPISLTVLMITIFHYLKRISKRSYLSFPLRKSTFKMRFSNLSILSAAKVASLA